MTVIRRALVALLTTSVVGLLYTFVISRGDILP
jgi:hypothetical protein